MEVLAADCDHQSLTDRRKVSARPSAQVTPTDRRGGSSPSERLTGGGKPASTPRVESERHSSSNDGTGMADDGLEVWSLAQKCQEGSEECLDVPQRTSWSGTWTRVPGEDGSRRRRIRDSSVRKTCQSVGTGTHTSGNCSTSPSSANEHSNTGEE